MTKIVSISWVRNEADIIGDFVRHHAGVFDRMVIVDNASTDATLSILQNLSDEGLPIEIHIDPSPIHSQGQALTNAMHRLYLTTDCDWILPLDADEFVVSHGSSFKDALHRISDQHVHSLNWRTYVPTPTDDVSETVIPTRITHRRKYEYPQFSKILIPRIYSGSAYTLPMGSHSLQYQGDDVLMMPTETMSIAHFPVRSPAQILRKITEGWERHHANPERIPGQNFHWERLYAEMKAGVEPSMERLQEIALHYAADPNENTEIVFDPVPHPLQ